MPRALDPAASQLLSGIDTQELRFRGLLGDVVSVPQKVNTLVNAMTVR
jgi:hypothetical protein